ncbi:hypothetical protein IX332_000065 [Porphyromonas levii]|nr:hypothetical protein [Porphyromonas levii]MBR8712323.1 hypothetical protein [Porphyromonas levii]MBR8714210.1 hypothetical protein [Porphyromonas levii]MBR8726752.1 hypothetical protein [Porphyromonas levii]MBR8728762.1 hypothetical protein [Porphyromonas levii]
MSFAFIIGLSSSLMSTHINLMAFVSDIQIANDPKVSSL